MSLRKFALPFFVTVLCLGQATWQAETNPPGVDWQGLTGPKKTAALRIMQTEDCDCGCNMKIAECRVKDPSCGDSKKLAKTVVKEIAAGKDAASIRADLKRIATEPPPTLDDDAVNISLAGDPVRGPANAKLTIVEFSDFQCPYCSKAVEEAKEVLRRFPNQVRLVFKQFPLDQHSEAEFGAEAALAAQAQGKFWEMHDLLYAGFPDIGKERVDAYARQLKLDMNRFHADLASHKYKARVLSEEKEGEDAGVSGTPTFFFNGRKYNEVFTAQSVAATLQKEFGIKPGR
ncbi:MAG: thioredoxin domain-containing protein [Acidobacteriota bacterium]|nr:thioredoxin domain-containing protein [Acidobacteriota bacterium]